MYRAKGGVYIYMKVKVVKASDASVLESKINTALSDLSLNQIIDIKFAGAYDGKDESFAAIIMYN